MCAWRVKLRKRGLRLLDRIICYGDIIDDIVVIPNGPIRSDTDTHSLIRIRPGGSAANTAAWLAAAGTPVEFYGVVGQDDGPRHANALPGVQTVLREHPILQTGRIVIVVQQEQRDMLTDRGANSALSPDDIPEARLREVRILHLTGHTLLNESGFEGIRSLIARCRATGVLVSVSPGSASFIAELEPKRVREIFDGVDFIFTALEDAALLTGESDPIAIAQELNSQFGIAVVTQGSLGYTVAINATAFSATVEATPIIDPTGAGDAFCAGFLGSWLGDNDIRRAGENGAALAAKAVGIVGGRPI